jgi:hypothetical protein
MVLVLTEVLQQVIAFRAKARPYGKYTVMGKKMQRRGSAIVADELSEVIDIQSLGNTANNNDGNASITSHGSDSLTDEEIVVPPLSATVRSQLRLFVNKIASMYKNNAFHNIHHAAHVTFASFELVRRISSFDIKPLLDKELSPWSTMPPMLECSNYLADDVLAQFAVVFSALIHDVDHTGVPNVQLAKERPDMAKRYKDKSLAEQNSLDIAWDLLESDTFSALRECIFPTENDQFRFRKMLVNLVMATDICDPALRTFQQKKLEKAFSDSNFEEIEERNRRATVAMDFIIQVSDISHTMQDFSVYQRWNENLYEELLAAYQEGRAEKDPTDGWWKGEFGFYDFHILPLIKKIQGTGVLGTTAGILFENAEHNRKSWEEMGEEKCKQMQERVKARLSSNGFRSQSSAGGVCRRFKSIMVGDFVKIDPLCCLRARSKVAHTS